MLIDTHCHIHEPDYGLPVDEVIKRARQNGVDQLICIGTDQSSSQRAVDFVAGRDGLYAAIGVHPHEAAGGWAAIEPLAATENPKIVAIGEIGLDYHYNFSPRQDQIKALEAQIEIALRHDLPIVFHVREAFDDFWPIFDNFRSHSNLRGVVHSFTDTPANAMECLRRGLMIGVNGFSTFVKDQQLIDMFAGLPLDQIVLETDAPYLTPNPFRGKINEPAFVRNVAEHQAMLRQISVTEVAQVTTANAKQLFKI